MTQFFHCFNSPSNRSSKQVPRPQNQQINDLSSVVKCIQRASLSTNDVGIKLQLRQVISFLQREPSPWVKSSKQSRCGVECLQSKIESCFPGCLQDPKKEERISTFYPMSWGRPENYQTVKSILLDKISHSALSREEPNLESYIKIENEVKSEYSQESMDDLTCRDKEHFYEGYKEHERQDDCKESLINRLEWKNIVTKNQIDEASHEGSGKEVSQKKVKSHQSSQPVSVGDIARSQREVLKEELRNSQTKVETLCEQLQSLKQKMKAKDEEVKKYELLLFVREEEVSSLRLMIKSQELKSNANPMTPAKALRKAFQPLQENLSSPFA